MFRVTPTFEDPPGIVRTTQFTYLAAKTDAALDSADPFVRDAADLQALNRYSYVENNPLSYTDPSGYFLKKLVKGIGRAIGKLLDGVGHAIKVALQKVGRVFGEIPGLSAAIGAMACGVMGPVGTACWATFSKVMTGLNAAITAANGGTIGQVLSGLATGAIAYGVPGGGGFWSGGLTAKVAEAMHSSFGALVFMGGAMAKAQGGKFIDGVKGAAIGFGVARIVAAVGEPVQMAAEDAAARDAAAGVYDDSGGLLSDFGIAYAPTDGFAASLTMGADGQYILAFRGTSPTSWANWKANIGQALFGQSTQHDQAIALASDVFHATGGNVTFVGHSLGGSLASAAAYATGGRAITFNAAGLHSAYRSGSRGEIRAHYIRGDVLTAVQRITPLPNAAGTSIGHSARWYKGPFQRHMMSNFP